MSSLQAPETIYSSIPPCSRNCVTCGTFDDDTVHEQLVRRQLSACSHKPIRSLPVNIVQFILFLGNVVLAFVYEYLYKRDDEKWGKGFLSPYSVLAYYHVFMWLCLLLLHSILRKLHRASLAEGYFTFYRHTREVRGAPFLIASTVNTFLLVFYIFLKDLSTETSGDDDSSPAHYTLYIVQAFTVVEFFIATVLISIYIHKVRQFNKIKQLPDFMLENNRFGDRGAGSSDGVIEIGFREVDRAAEIIERQNDIIEHLKDKLRKYTVVQDGDVNGHHCHLQRITNSSVFSNDPPDTR